MGNSELGIFNAECEVRPEGIPAEEWGMSYNVHYRIANHDQAIKRMRILKEMHFKSADAMQKFPLCDIKMPNVMRLNI